MLWRIFAFFGKTTPYGKIVKILFQTFSLPHRSTLLCSNVVKFFRIFWGEIVRYLPDKNKIWPASHTVATARIAPKMCRCQSPTMYSECSRFHPNRFTFGGVIAGRVNTAKLPRIVNPIFDGSLASSRIVSSLLRTSNIKNH